MAGVRCGVHEVDEVEPEVGVGVAGDVRDGPGHGERAKDAPSKRVTNGQLIRWGYTTRLTLPRRGSREGESRKRERR